MLNRYMISNGIYSIVIISMMFISFISNFMFIFKFIDLFLIMYIHKDAGIPCAAWVVNF